MKHRAVIFAALILAAFAAPASASGDCSVFYRVYGQPNAQGPAVTVCYGINDNNVSGEGNGIGPDYLGRILPDFDNTETDSGISSVYFGDPVGGIDSGICLYKNAGYATQTFKITANGYYNLPAIADNVTSSIAWQYSAAYCQ